MKVKGLRLVFSETQIQRRILELAAELDTLYGDDPLVIVCVLKGAAFFFTDLVRRLKKSQVELEFVRLSSYGVADTPSSTITFSKDVELSLEGKHVLIVEDIMDTGHSMHFLLQQFATRGVKSLRLIVLLDKRGRRDVLVKADFVGFHLQSGFLVGYGLDYAESYRHLPAVYEVIPE